MLVFPRIFCLSAWRLQNLTGIASQTRFQSWEVLRDTLKHELGLILVRIFKLIHLKFEHVKLSHGVQESKFQSCYV